MLNVFSFPFQFSLPLIFTLHWWPPAFLILSPPLQNFHVVLASNRKMSPLFFISRSRSLLPFFSLTFADLPPTFSFSLSFSCCIFQICGHDNLSTLNNLDNRDTETISAFRFRRYWLFSCLCFTRRGWLCDFPLKQPWIAFGLPYLKSARPPGFFGFSFTRREGERSDDRKYVCGSRALR